MICGDFEPFIISESAAISNSRAPRSRPEVGSSRTSTSGSVMSARARRTRWASPSESVENSRWARWSTPKISMSAAARASSTSSYSSSWATARPQAALRTVSNTDCVGTIFAATAAEAKPTRVATSAGSACAMSVSDRVTSPESGATLPEATRASVVLPAPLGPTMTQCWRGRVDHETSDRTCVSPRVRDTWERFRT